MAPVVDEDGGETKLLEQLQQQNAEEQEMEAEALAAIFDCQFTVTRPGHWDVDLYPHVGGDEVNHVACRLIVSLPRSYPSQALPNLKIEIIRGLLEDEHALPLQSLAEEEAVKNEGEPSIFAICERIRDWLVDNNIKGLDDQSMYAQMLRKQRMISNQSELNAVHFESQTVRDELTATEQEEMEVQQRREYGTPCNKENFEAWKARFEAEMTETAMRSPAGSSASAAVVAAAAAAAAKRDGRLTGYQQFAANMNLEALEAAAERAEVEHHQPDDDVNEDLFQDDVDLDDLDFDESEDDDDVQ